MSAVVLRQVAGQISTISVATAEDLAVVFDDATPGDNQNIRAARTDFSPVNNARVGITNFGRDQQEDPIGATADDATIGGGNRNEATADSTTVAGGTQNKANALGASIGGGRINTAGGIDSAIAGGNGNETTGSGGAIPGGHNNEAVGVDSLATGNSNVALSDYSSAHGLYAASEWSGSEVSASGRFVEVADAMRGALVLRAIDNGDASVGDRITPMTSGAATTNLPLASGYSYFFEVIVTFGFNVAGPNNTSFGNTYRCAAHCTGGTAAIDAQDAGAPLGVADKQEMSASFTVSGGNLQFNIVRGFSEPDNAPCSAVAYLRFARVQFQTFA